MGGAASLSAGQRREGNEEEGGSKLSSLFNTIGLKGSSLLNRFRGRAGSVGDDSPAHEATGREEQEKEKPKRKKSKSQKHVSRGGPEDWGGTSSQAAEGDGRRSEGDEDGGREKSDKTVEVVHDDDEDEEFLEAVNEMGDGRIEIKKKTSSLSMSLHEIEAASSEQIQLSPTSSEKNQDISNKADGSDKDKSSKSLKKRDDLKGPQRFLVTIDKCERLVVMEGKIRFRVTMEGRVRESKSFVIGDQLVQGIVKVWTGTLIVREEFYFEVTQPDSFAVVEVIHVFEPQASDPVESVLGKAQIHPKAGDAGSRQTVKLSDEAGALQASCMKVGAMQDSFKSEDEQAYISAMQIHADVPKSMMRLRVRVVQAFDIPAMDASGTSDPYIILTCGSVKKRSKVQMKTLHPQWHEDFDFFFPANQPISNLDIEMWDRDTAARDDFMGKTSISIGGLVYVPPTLQWLQLKNKEEAAGRLQIFLKMEPKTGTSDSPLRHDIERWFASESQMLGFWEGITGGMKSLRAAVSTPETNEMSPAMLKITVLRAKELMAADRGGTSDPYVKIHIGDNVKNAKKTQVKKKTLDPTWMETFEFLIPGSERTEAINVECLDKDLIGSDDTLGQFGIALDTLVPDKEYRSWYSFAEVDGKSFPGQVELQFVLREVLESSKEEQGEKPQPQQGPGKSQAASHASGAIKGVQVVVVGGRAMPKMDSGPFGKCDPYLILKFGQQEEKTQVVKRSLAPTWNETFHFDFKEEEMSSELLVECYDYDMIGSHDFIGSTSIEIHALTSKKSEWFKLVHPENPSFNAEVFLTLVPALESKQEIEKKAANAPDAAAVKTILILDLVAGRGLEAMDSNGTSDPYAIIQVGSEKKKSKVIKKELNPEWNEKFEMMVSDLNDSLRVSVWDKDLIGSDDLIGETIIPLSTILGQKVPQKWYTIFRDSKIMGEILMGMKLPKPEGYVEPSFPGALETSNDTDTESSSLSDLRQKRCCPQDVRVYISCTLSDFSYERHLLHEAVMPELRRFCESRFITCTAVDVRMGMIEETQEVVKLCLDELDKSSIFVCLVGEKYGTRVEDVSSLVTQRPWTETLKGKSIVEFEVAAALIDDPSKFANRAFVYLRDPSFIDSIPGLNRGDFSEEDPSNLLALEAFKKRLHSIEHLPVVDNYPEPSKVMDKIQRDLRRVVKKVYDKETRRRLLAPQRKFNLSYCSEPIPHFVLDPEPGLRLNNYIAFDDRSLMLILGSSGSGKTSFIRTWANIYELKRSRDVFFFLHFDLGAAGVESARGVLRRILFEMKAFFGIEGDVPIDYVQIKRTFLLWILHGTTKGGIVLVIDGADGFDEPNDGILSLLQCIPETLPKGLKIVLSMTTGAPVSNLVLKRMQSCKTITLGALSVQMRQTICESVFKAHGMDPEAHEEKIIHDPESRCPVRLKLRMQSLIHTGEYLHSQTLQETVLQLLVLLENKFHDESPGLVETVFASIARSRRGMTDSELIAIVGINRHMWSRFSHASEELLTGLSSLVNFQHEIIDDAVNAKYLDTEEKKQRRTVALATFFEACPLSFRKIEEYPWLLTTNARYWFETAQPGEYKNVWKKLRDCLVDLDFFQEIYQDYFVSDLHDLWEEMASVYDLVEEYTNSVNSYASKTAYSSSSDRIVAKVHLALCQTKVARFFRDCSRYEAAEEMFLRALESWRLCPGREEDVVNVYLELGLMLRTWGKYAEAEETLKSSFPVLERGQGKANSIRMGEVLHYVSDCLRRQKKESEAFYYADRSFQRLKDSLDPDTLDKSPLYARCLYNLGVVCEILDKKSAALEHYEKSVVVFERSLGALNVEYSQALESLAASYQGIGELTKAAASYQKLLPIKAEMSFLGGSLGDVTSAQNNLASIFVKLGDLKAAELLYRKAVRHREHYYGHSHPTVARSLEMLGNLLTELGELQEATLLLQRALSIRSEAFGKDDVESAATMLNLSTVQCRRGQYVSGRDMFKKWLRIMLQALGASHPTCIWAVQWLDRWPEGEAPGTRLSKAEDGRRGALPAGKLIVKILRGRRLKAMDNGKTSDPYVVVELSGQRKKTWPKLKTTNPEWNEVMEFNVSKDDRMNGELALQCFDKDLIGEDDNMGSFIIKINQLPLAQPYRVWQAFDDPEEFPGEIEVEVLLLENELIGMPFQASKEGPSLLAQIEERRRAEKLREAQLADASLQQQERETRMKVREKINRASETKIERDRRREARIAAGLDPDMDIDDPEALADWDEHESADQNVADETAVNDQQQTESEEAGGSDAEGKTAEAREGEGAEEDEDMAWDDQGASRLHYAAMYGKEDKVNELLDKKFNPNVRDKDGLTPLHYACGEGHLGIVVILLQRGGDVFAKDKDGDGPLHVAVQERQEEICSYLLRHKPEVIDMPGAHGNTALHLLAAMDSEWESLLVTLLESGADPNVKNDDGETPVQLAKEVFDAIFNHPHYLILSRALGLSASQDEARGAPFKPKIALKLWSVIEQNDTEVMLKYLRGGLDIDGRLDETGLTMLMLAAQEMKRDLLVLLADPGWDLNINIQTQTGQTALHHLIFNGRDLSVEYLDILLKLNPDVNVQDSKGYTALHYAVELCGEQVVTALIDKGGADLQLATHAGDTPLHLSALSCREDVVPLLVKKLEMRSKHQFTFVSSDMAMRDALNKMNQAGDTALHLACRSDSNLRIVRLLLQHGANINSLNKNEETPLDVAQQYRQGDMINLLNEWFKNDEASTNSDVVKQVTRLTFAIRDDDRELVKNIASSGMLDLNSACNEIGDTYCHIAAAEGRVEILKALFLDGCYLHNQNLLGCTPLHAAAMKGQVGAIKWLLQNGADPRASDSEGYCPMHYAAGEGHVDAIDCLLNVGRCDETLKTFQGLTMLHIAISEKRRDVIVYLLKRNPQFASLSDSDGKLPLDYCELNGFDDQDVIRQIQAASTGSRVMLLVENMRD